MIVQQRFSMMGSNSAEQAAGKKEDLCRWEKEKITSGSEQAAEKGRIESEYRTLSG
jgi:hypothetical protein